MSEIERFRVLYEHEKDSNHKMLAMIESVPEARRGDARFQRAVMLAGHLAACRENFLDFMAGDGRHQVPWWDAARDLSTLRSRYAALETAWTDYFAHLDDVELAEYFDIIEGDERFPLPRAVQAEQLVGHAAYHRGQIALLVDQLGGETVDTDYADWWWAHRR